MIDFLRGKLKSALRNNLTHLLHTKYANVETHADPDG